jgi:hypothetical protein
MKLSKLLLAAPIAALAFTGCATTPAQSAANSEVDAQHMAAVNDITRSFGVKVIWVNPPTRPISTTPSGS